MSRIDSTKSLRSFLLDQMEGVASGDVEPDRAKAVTNVAQQIYHTILIEIKVAQARFKMGDEAIKPVTFNE